MNWARQHTARGAQAGAARSTRRAPGRMGTTVAAERSSTIGRVPGPWWRLRCWFAVAMLSRFLSIDISRASVLVVPMCPFVSGVKDTTGGPVVTLATRAGGLPTTGTVRAGEVRVVASRALPL
jgi:hypothetical protein